MTNFNRQESQATQAAEMLVGPNSRSPLTFTSQIQHSESTGLENDLDTWLRLLVTTDRENREEVQALAETGRWKGTYKNNTAYSVNDEVKRNSDYLRRHTAGNSGGSYNANQWVILAGLELAAAKFHEAFANVVNSLPNLEEYKGVWTNAAADFNFKQGDVVEHPLAGGTNFKIFYMCRQDHAKGSNAPDLDTTNWHLLTPVYQGAHIDSWYHSGAMVIDNSEFWVAKEHVVRGDPAPSASNNTKWGSISGESVTKARVYSRLKEILVKGSHINLTEDDDLESITVGTVGSTDSFERETTDGTVLWDGNGELHHVSIPLHGLSKGDIIELRGTVTPPDGANLTGVYWQATNPDNGYAFNIAQVIADSTQTTRRGWLQTANVRIGPESEQPTRSSDMPGAVRQIDSDPIESITFVEALKDLESVTVYFCVMGRGTGNQHAIATTTAFAPSPVSQEVAYYGAKRVLRGGSNISLRADDAKEEITVETKTTVPRAPLAANSFWGRAVGQTSETSEALRYRSVDSQDTREAPDDAYSLTWKRNSPLRVTADGVDFIDLFSPQSPSNPDGYDANRPGLIFISNTTTRGGKKIKPRFHMNGVDFTAANAGTTTREFDVTIKLTPANERTYGSDERVTVGFSHAYTDGLVLSSRRGFDFRGGHQDPFTYTYRFTLTRAPVSVGNQDYFQITLDVDFGSQQNIEGTTFSEIDVTFSLPHAGQNVVPTWGLYDATTQVSVDELASEIGMHNPWLINLSIDDAEEAKLGLSTEAKETDKAEVQDKFHPSDPSSTVPQLVYALRDLRRVKISVASSATSTVPHNVKVFLISWVPDLFDPFVVGSFNITKGSYDYEFNVDGVLENQHFMFVATERIWANNAVSTRPHFGNIGYPEFKWDVTIQPSLGQVFQVIPGLVETRTVVIGNNTREKILGTVKQLPPPENWLAMHFRSNGVEATVPIPPGYFVAEAHDTPSGEHPALVGAAHRSRNKTGTIVTNKLVALTKDIQTDPHQYQVAFYGDDGVREASPWIEEILIDYIR